MASPPPWAELPREITAVILQNLGSIEILTSSQKVCTAWRSVWQDHDMWRVIDMRNSGNLWDMPYDLEKMCRHAVDRSRGQLLHINIEYFGTDELLDYIAQGSEQLKSLRLVRCYDVSSHGLSEAVKKLPLLEELHLYYTAITKEAIEIVGRSCPLLKSFKLNNQGFIYPLIDCNEEALAVAETMPALRHLQLFGNKMNNEGLIAILDGCAHLESLDLRQCFNVSLGGESATLRKRCSQQIKYLRRPYDSTEDYEFDDQIHNYESFDEDYPSEISDLVMSENDGYFEFSCGSQNSDYESMFFD